MRADLDAVLQRLPLRLRRLGMQHGLDIQVLEVPVPLQSQFIRVNLLRGLQAVNIIICLRVVFLERRGSLSNFSLLRGFGRDPERHLFFLLELLVGTRFLLEVVLLHQIHLGFVRLERAVSNHIRLMLRGLLLLPRPLLDLLWALASEELGLVTKLALVAGLKGVRSLLFKVQVLRLLSPHPL